jgi:hypothetical protein
MCSDVVMENLLFNVQDFLADGSADLFGEPSPDVAGRDTHGSLQSAITPRISRMVPGVILVRGDEDGQ